MRHTVRFSPGLRRRGENQGGTRMDIKIARSFYNAAGVTPQSDPLDEKSQFAVERYKKQLNNIVYVKAMVLDIGCGAGRYTFALEKMGAVPIGIDCADEVIQYAKTIAIQINSKAEFICEDALKMPFIDESFDLVFLLGNNIVEFSFDDIFKMCEQIKRVLKTGGMFCVGMNDSVIHNNGKVIELKNYNYKSGQLRSEYNIPDKGDFEYHSYFWTVAFAKFIFSMYFDDIDIEQLDEKCFWIVCKKR